jgi:hypothetical protein
MNGRSLVLILALAVTALLAFWPMPEDEAGLVDPVRKSHPAAARSGGAAAAPAKAEPVVRFAVLDGDLFPSQTWRPPPPKAKPVKPLPPPPPEPPEFFFSYFGRWVEAGKEVIFLKQGERLMRTAVGEVVAGQWRLDQVGPGGLVFTYLPLNMQKTLRTQ